MRKREGSWEIVILEIESEAITMAIFRTLEITEVQLLLSYRDLRMVVKVDRFTGEALYEAL